MHTTANDMLPPLHRMLLGFYENDINGHRVITHAGDTEWFHTELNLLARRQRGALHFHEQPRQRWGCWSDPHDVVQGIRAIATSLRRLLKEPSTRKRRRNMRN